MQTPEAVAASLLNITALAHTVEMMANVGPGSSPRPFRKIRQLKMLDELESEGWDIKDFNIELCCIDPVDLSRIPSPLANLADDTERIMRIINNHVHPQLSFLFHCIYDGNNGEFAELMNLLDKSPPGAFGAFHGDGMGPQFFAVPPNKPKFSLLLDRRNGSEHRTHLEIRASRNARTGEIGYFVVNEQRNLHINENLIARNSVAGPLPDFAVIQIGYWVVFWWRSRAAMGYVPEMVSQASSIDSQF